MERLKRRRLIQGNCLVICIAVLVLIIPFSLSADDDDMFLLPPMEEFEVDEITDEDLERFGLALIAIQQIEFNANEVIREVVEESALSEERLNEILLVHQDPEAEDDSVTDEELAEFEKTILDITEVHQEAQDDIIEAVDTYGFEVQEFNEIAQAIQEDPELLNRLESLFAN